MKAQRKENLVQAIILAGFAFLLFNLLNTGKIVLFINPRLAWLIGLASVLLGIIAIAELIPRHDHGHECCDHDHACACDHGAHLLITGNKLLAVLFLTPLVLGFLMQPKVLGSAALTNSINAAGPVPFYAGPFTGLNKNGADLLAGIMNLARGLGRPAPPASGNSPAASVPGANTAGANTQTTAAGTDAEGAPEASQNTSLVQDAGDAGPAVGPVEDTDLVQLDIDLYENQAQLSGRRFRMTGFVYKDPGLGKNQFVITRFVIVCCLLDTVPIGIIAESPDASDLKADTWVEAEGVMKMLNTFSAADKIEPLSNFHGPNTDIPYFVITSLKKVPVPKDPYLYPPQ
ncbi:MAG: TIGR03943 family protein [Thermacetogeniaceae bacterium]|jgi:putative membrane protein